MQMSRSAGRSRHPGTQAEVAKQHVEILERILDFEAAPLAAVLVVDGQLAAMLRDGTSAVPSQLPTHGQRAPPPAVSLEHETAS